MNDKIKFNLTEIEESLILKSLVLFKNNLIAQNRPTVDVDDIILRISDKHRIDLDTIDAGIVINSLSALRHKLKSENLPRTEINAILGKMVDETDSKKKLLLRKTRGNGRKF